MERAIDPLLTIDAKLWADEFMATKQRLGDAEFDHAMMLGWFANAIMRGYDAGRDLMMPTLSSPDAQATIATLQADNRTYINERHEHMKQIEQLQAMNNRLGVRVETLESQLTQRTAELEAAKTRAHESESKATEFSVKLRQAREERDNLRLRIQAVDKEHEQLAVDRQKMTGTVESLLTERDNLRAELERVREELADERTAYKALSEQYNRLDLEHSDLRTLLLALPKVEGEIAVKRTEVDLSDVWGITLNGYFTFQSALFDSKEETDAYAAILKHRQGMEG